MLQRFLLQRAVGKGVLPIMLVTFGLSIIIQNGLLESLRRPTPARSRAARSRRRRVPARRRIEIGVCPLLVFAARDRRRSPASTRCSTARSIGARIRAVADDLAAADLIGLTSARIYADRDGHRRHHDASRLPPACRSGRNFDPASGPSRLLIAFEAVVLGGLGSLWGTLAGGILLGVAQSVGAQFDAAWQVLAQHLFFLVVLVLRPQGLFPKN